MRPDAEHSQPFVARSCGFERDLKPLNEIRPPAVPTPTLASKPRPWYSV
jgi:hypothetical protein